MNPEVNSKLEAARHALMRRGGVGVDLPTLLPAGLVLELAGEDLRARLFFATGPSGDEMCLRADLTIPAAVKYAAIAQTNDEPQAWVCEGKVFRAPRTGEDRPPEFVQIGLERFGDPDTIDADVSVFLAAWEASKAAGLNTIHVRLCDGGLLPLILEAANLPEPWGTALSQSVNHGAAFTRLLAMASGQSPRRDISALERTVAELDSVRARETVEEVLSIANLALPGLRTIDQVADRLAKRAQRALAEPLDPVVSDTLLALTRVRSTGSIPECLDEIVSLGQKLGVDISDWREAWGKRLLSIQEQAPDALDFAHFEALGPEAFDYYNGMSFDLSASADFNRPVATGGRYDGLVGEVSGGLRQARAVGCVVRPARFEGGQS